MAALPDRIWVVGPCGSGKSTLTRVLAARQGVEPTHLDDIHWAPGWVERPEAEMHAALAPIVAHPRWVIDGNYGIYRQRHLDRTDLTVWLDFPLRVTWPRLLWRGIRRSVRKESVCNGNQESLWRTFCDRDSLLVYSIQTHGRRRRGLEKELATRPHVRLRSQREMDRWLAGLGGGGFGDGSPEV